MNRRFLGVLSIVAALVVVTGCASSPSSSRGNGDGGQGSGSVPQWYEDPKSVYPDEEYLSAIGSGDTRRSAEQDALGSLSQVFEARVSVDNRINERYREIARGSETLTESEVEIAGATSVQSDERLVNVQHGESFTDSQGRVHVIAYMNRMETGRVYRDLIQKNGEQVRRFMQESRGEEGVVRRFAYLSAANVVAQNNRSLIDQLQIIFAPMARTLQLPYDEQEVTERRAELASRMAYRITLSGEGAARIEQALGEALSSEGFVVSQDGPLQVRGEAELEAEEDGKYEVTRWYMNLEFVDPSDSVVVAYNEQDRASGVSREASRSFAFNDMEEAAREEFVAHVIEYFDSLVIQ
ncbi:MAG: LPP20 family lipoprotein [Spirochaetia bacterium]